ncbi:MAG: hypothetical protein ABEK17_02610 [Candidatus Aenigmatarchaeota archaeon]
MKNKKGVSLPVNVLVILAIGIVVLVGLLAFFSGTTGETGGQVNAQTKFNNCCNFYLRSGCQSIPSGVDVVGCPSGESLWDLAKEANIVADTAKFDDDNWARVNATCGC